ncbi:protein fluG [Penicillium brasilianum]|uniref:Protein fluG n=1 Tax=Penicillium brasilianum TaxID=104259 RepID=A0A1S9RFK5_PENBI|nr:protein fluG [Penicillium brasilianum]
MVANLAEEFFTKNNSVKFVRLHWVDYSGVLRTRIITKARCLRLAQGTDCYHLDQYCMIIPISTAPLCSSDSVEQWILNLDLESLMVCGFAPTHASVMCSTTHTGLKDPVARCPRTLLHKTVRTFQESCQSKLLMSFEIEFVLLDETLQPATSFDRMTGYSMTAGLRTNNLVILEEIVNALEVSGIEIYHFHTEGVEQFEIALSPLSPMKAIDALMMTQETIRTISIRHGLKATTAPRPTFHGPPSGCHLHLSLNPVPSKDASSFLAGILQSMKTLCALGLPTYDSYHRVIGGGNVGEWIGWGTHNKDFPIRQVSSNRWEFRFLDATANVYLFVAALLSSGMSGIQKNQVLTYADCPVVPSAIDSNEEAGRRLREFGITERMPKTFAVSLSHAREDKDLQSWMGVELFSQYMKIKETELEHFSKMTDEERRRKILDYF